MSLATRVRQSNPVSTPSHLTERGRSELAALLGTDDVPSPRAHKPRRLVRRWVAAGAAVALVAGGITLGVTLPGAHHTVLPAWAQPITAPVVDGTSNPVPYGLSIIVDFPVPDQLGTPALHYVMRFWINDPNKNWRNTPSAITFEPRAAGGTWAAYVATNWPVSYGMGIIVGHGTNGPDGCAPVATPELDVPMMSFWWCGQDPNTYATPIGGVGGFMGLGDTMIVDGGYLTTDPGAAIDLLNRYELSPTGAWTAWPAGEDAPPDISDQLSRTVPGTTLLKPGSHTVADTERGLSATITVEENLQCTISGDVDYAAEQGFSLNPDGTCSYEP